MTADFVEDFPAAAPQFDFDLIAASLMPLLRQSTTQGALVLGIHGPWGSGKTTLMDAVGRAVSASQGDDFRPVFVHFNAWKFQDREALWRALILHLVAELRMLADQDGATQADKDAARKLDELKQSLYRAFIVQEKGPWTVNWRSLITELITIALSVIHLDFVGKALAASSSWLAKLFRKTKGGDGLDEKSIEQFGSILERATTQRQVDQVQSIEQFLDRFRQVMQGLQAADRRVYVLVDDLDRCLPEAALDIFESIKLFLDAPGCVFVVALDRDVIRKGLSLRYGSATQGGSALFIDPDEYIEKTISISYDLPRLSDADARAIIGGFQLPVKLSRAQQDLVIAGLGTNPRRVKRFMNTLGVQLRLAKLAVDHGRPVPDSLLNEDDPDVLGRFVKLLLISYRFSGVFALLFEDQDLLLQLQKLAHSSKSKENRHLRDEQLKHERFVVQALEADEEFWRLMRRQPQFNEEDGTTGALLRWFRHDVGVSS
jgi:predicted KAP-like P-loop ATPase